MTYVRTTTGEKILCCWDDCQKPGKDEIRVRLQHESKEWWIYIFCSDFHMNLFKHSHVEYNRVEVGSGRGA